MALGNRKTGALMKQNGRIQTYSRACGLRIRMQQTIKCQNTPSVREKTLSYQGQHYSRNASGSDLETHPITHPPQEQDAEWTQAS